MPDTHRMSKLRYLYHRHRVPIFMPPSVDSNDGVTGRQETRPRGPVWLIVPAYRPTYPCPMADAFATDGSNPDKMIEALEMPFVKDDYVIETFSAKTVDLDASERGAAWPRVAHPARDPSSRLHSHTVCRPLR